MSDVTDEGISPATAGDEEVVIPAPCAVTVFVGALTASGDFEVGRRLIVGWNAAGSPVVVGDDGGLRLLFDDESVSDLTWGND